MESENFGEAVRFYQILVTLHENLNRFLIVSQVSATIVKSERLRPSEDSVSQQHTQFFFAEIRRQRVVFLHAALEDTLRELIRLRLKHASDVSLPVHMKFSGTEASKINLDWLRRNHGEKVVAELIEASIDSHLEKLTFGSATKIFSELELVNIHLSDEAKNAYAPTLDSLCQRRHQIVHRADRLTGEDGRRMLKPLLEVELARWQVGSYQFMLEVLNSAIPDNLSGDASLKIIGMIQRLNEVIAELHEGDDIDFDMATFTL